MDTGKRPSTDEKRTDGVFLLPLEEGYSSLEEKSVKPRPYIKIQPAEAPVDADSWSRAMARIGVLLRAHSHQSLWSRLRDTAVTPIVEFLLVTDGRPDPTIQNLVGTNVSALTADLENTIRTGLPNSYELSLTEWHPLLVDNTRQFPEDQNPFEQPYVAGVEYRGRVRRKRDWQTPLTSLQSFADSEASPDASESSDNWRVPLSAVVERLSDAKCPVIFQVVVRPQADWTKDAKRYLNDLDEGRVSIGDKIWEFLSRPDRDARQRYKPPPADRERIDGITDRDPKQTFLISARAVALGAENHGLADDAARRLSTALSSLSGPHHEVVGHVVDDAEVHDGRGLPPGSGIYEDLRNRSVYPATYDRIADRLLRRPHESKGLVVAPEELAGFCVLDGAGLTQNGRRAIAARPTERTGLQLPPAAQLERYHAPGMALGRPLTADRRPTNLPMYLPADDQDRHVIAIGPTGAGKSVLMETAILTNLQSTDGPAILLDYKGGGTASEYLQAHYAAYGTLEDVTYFDCTRVLPALSVLDIRPLLAAGIPREEARSRIAGHYEEMLAGVMGYDRYWQAVEAPKAVRNHLRALFDPVNGADVVSHVALYESLHRTLRGDDPPTVADDRLATYFESLLDRDRVVFKRVLGGALNRVETIATDGRLAPLFDHVPGDTDPHFDFADIIEEDRVVIFDFGGMEDDAKRSLTLALLSNLWRALTARAQDPDAPVDPPLVNCYLEEAGAIAESAILDTLLSQGRSFGLSMFLGIQFLGQLDSPDPSSRSHEEAVNETATILAGRVAVRDDLVDALASDALPPTEINRRLSRLPRGEWLVRPATAFGAESVRPFLLESLPAPPGHPEGDDPLNAATRRAFEAAFDAIRSATADAAGLVHDDPEQLGGAAGHAADLPPRVDTAYRYTERLPATVRYNVASNALQCRECNSRYDPTFDGLREAVECHGSLAEVDRDDIPIGRLHLKRPPAARRDADLSERQFMFLQAVHNAQQGRYHQLEYDLTRDSMLRLQEYVGIDSDAVRSLIEEGLLRKDGDHPHRLYSVTPDGRTAIGESYREGVDYGHGLGDLEESSQHILGITLAERFLEAEYVDDSASSVEHVERYYDIGGNQRLDVAGISSDGNIEITVEVERVNHDIRRAAPDDFDKMAECKPNEAIWVVMSHSDAHQILDALNEPLDGDCRVGKTYSKSTPASNFLVSKPGFTQVYTIDQLRTILDLK